MKNRGSGKVTSVPDVLLLASYFCRETLREFKNRAISCFILFNFRKQLSIIDPLSELR